MTDYSSFVVAVREGQPNPQMYRNPFDIPRCHLLDQLVRMRANYLGAAPGLLLTEHSSDQLHCRPIAQMGNYQVLLEYLDMVGLY